MAFRQIVRTQTTNYRSHLTIPQRNISFSQIGLKLDGLKKQLESKFIRENHIDFSYRSRLAEDHIKKSKLEISFLRSVELKELKDLENDCKENYIQWKSRELKSKVFMASCITGISYYLLKNGQTCDLNIFMDYFTGLAACWNKYEAIQDKKEYKSLTDKLRPFFVSFYERLGY